MTPATRTGLDDRILASGPGSYPWDDWERAAVAAGIAPELAALGRSVMREAYQHDWCAQLKYECGLDNQDTAAGMIACAREQPHLAESRWQWLLATDGLRFDPWEHQERSEDSPEWNALLLRWQAEQSKAVSLEVALQREAIGYIVQFYGLNQLARIDLTRHGVSERQDAVTLWADFTVIGPEIPHRITHSGVVRIERDPDGASLDAAIFERVEES